MRARCCHAQYDVDGSVDLCNFKIIHWDETNRKLSRSSSAARLRDDGIAQDGRWRGVHWSAARPRRSLATMSGSTIAHELAALGRRFYNRGWALGTSGNFSAVLSRDPLRLAITASSVHKGELGDSDILEVDERGAVAARTPGRPSAETVLHIEIVRHTGAGAVMHTHSVWGTILSGGSANRDGLEIEGFEMLKGLRGVTTHEHREWIPILDNDQDMARLAAVVDDTLKQNPRAHGFLLRHHGLYTWGTTLAEAERHVEILEFLFETLGRTATFHAIGTKAEEAYHGAVENS
jgi:methylthioribulose-1-phosphate dehydratase